MTDIEAVAEIIKILAKLKSSRRRSAVIEFVAESAACDEDEKYQSTLGDYCDQFQIGHTAMEKLKSEYMQAKKLKQ